MLEDQYAEAEARVKEMRDELSALRQKLQITSLDEARYADPGRSDADNWHKMESQRVEATARYIQVSTMYNALANLPRAELRGAILAAAPDPIMTLLLEQQARTEQKLVELSDSYSANHPEVKLTHKLLQKINKQIEERLDGILFGLKIKVEAAKADLDHLDAEVQKAKQGDIELAAKFHRYWVARRDLEQSELARERIRMRITQEKIDAALSKQNDNPK